MTHVSDLVEFLSKNAATKW